LLRIAVLIAQAVLGDMPLALAVEALLQILVYPIVHIISLILLLIPL
jgi:hypothetical protein